LLNPPSNCHYHFRLFIIQYFNKNGNRATDLCEILRSGKNIKSPFEILLAKNGRGIVTGIISQLSRRYNLFFFSNRLANITSLYYYMGMKKEKTFQSGAANE
jgi:hypothetical protein